MKFDKTIALLAGAFRPPTFAHLEMAKHYAGKADKIVISISNPEGEESVRKTKLGTEIAPDVSKRIWDIYLEAAGLSDKAVAVVSEEPSPVSSVISYVRDLKDCNVILGVSKKEGDGSRYDEIYSWMKDREDVDVQDPSETAFEPVEKDGKPVSATDARNGIDKFAVVQEFLPDCLSEDQKKEVCDLLGTKPVTEADLFTDDPISPFAFSFDDDFISGCTCSKAFCPKCGKNKCDIKFQIPVAGHGIKSFNIGLFLDDGCEWHSETDKGSLSPDKMGEFFKTDFYSKLKEELRKNGVELKVNKLSIGEDAIGEAGEFRKGNIDKEKSRQDTSHDGRIDRTNSGRKIVDFSDFGVTKKDQAKCYCWPKLGSEFRWSQWADWKKINPLARLSFWHREYEYGMSIKPIPEPDENRGFWHYNLSLEPKLQYLTPVEGQQIMELTFVRRWLNACVKRIKYYLDMDDEEIFKKVGNPERCSLEQIKKTKAIIKKTLECFYRADTHIYT